MMCDSLIQQDISVHLVAVYAHMRHSSRNKHNYEQNQ
jgi:hypothetical protein